MDFDKAQTDLLASSKSIDDAPLNAFHIKMTILTFGANLTAGYAIGSIALVLSYLTNEVGITAVQQGLLGSSALIGVFFGSIITGVVADRFGRQRIFLFSFVAITIATALQYIAYDITFLIVLRLIAGVALGADYSVGAALLAEVLPRKWRGPLLGCLVAVWTVGYVGSSLVGNYFIAPSDWNLYLATASIPAVIVLVLRIGTPESPRWLASHGRADEAERVVALYIGEGYTLPQEPPSVTTDKKRIIRQYWKPLVFVCLFFSLDVIPYFGIYTFLPMILSAVNFADTEAADMILNLVLLMGAVLGVFLVAKLTRRSLSIGTFAIMAASLLFLILLPNTYPVGQMLAFSLFALSIAVQGDMPSVYTSELFPTEVRSTCIGLATGVSRIASAAGTFFIPILMSIGGYGMTLGVLCALCIAGMFVCIAMAPETKDASLEDASHL